MTRLLRLLLFALLAAAVLPTGSALGLGGDDEEKERDLRLKETEQRFKGKTPQEREEFRRKLERLRQMSEIEKDALRRKFRKIQLIADHLAKDLPDDVKDKLDGLPRGERDAVLHYAVDRMLCMVRDEMHSSLTTEERARVDKLKCRERHGAVLGIKKRKILERLSPEQRAEFEALPDAERKQRMRDMMRRAFDSERRKARESVVEEIRRLLDSPSAEREERLRRTRIRQELERLGYADRELPRLLSVLSYTELRRAMSELRGIRKIKDPESRRKALDALKTRLAQ